MRILAFSDVHTDLAACEQIVAAGNDADLVIGAGDFAQRREGLAAVMEVLAPLAAKSIYVPGNNETFTELCAVTTATVLHGDRCEVGRVNIFGIGAAIPPLPPLPWGSFDLSEDEAEALFSLGGAPDILISHSPPKGVVDLHASAGSIGSTSLRDAIVRMNPRLVFCGHVHDCWGQSGLLGNSQVHNLGPTVNWFEI